MASAQQDHWSEMSLETSTTPRDHPGSAIAILVDYDGTIATNDVTDDLIRAASSETEWRALGLTNPNRTIGLRALLLAEVRLLPGGSVARADLLRRQTHDPAFP